jgi:Fe2+ transport system protein B
MPPTSGVISEAWNLYKTHWRHLLSISFIVYLAVAIIGVVLVALLTWLGAILAVLVSFIALFWLQAALVKAVEDIRDGRVDLSVNDTFQAARAHLAAVIVAGILAGIAIVIGFVLLIIPGLVLLTFWCVIVPAIVMEGKSAGESFGRSFDLVRGHFWRVLGVIVLAALIYFGFEIVLALILSPLADWLKNFVSTIVSGTLTAPFFALVLTVLYFRLSAAQELTNAPAPTGPSQQPPPADMPDDEPSPPVRPG